MGVTIEENIKDIVKRRYYSCAERGGGESAVRCRGEAPANPSFAAKHGLHSQEELSLTPETAFTLSRGCGYSFITCSLASARHSSIFLRRRCSDISMPPSCRSPGILRTRSASPGSAKSAEITSLA